MDPAKDHDKLMEFRSLAKKKASKWYREARARQKEDPESFQDREPIGSKLRDRWEDTFFAEFVADWEIEREKDPTYAKKQRKTDAYQKELEGWRKNDFPVVVEEFQKVRNKGRNNKKYQKALQHMENLFPEDLYDDGADVGADEEPDGLEISMARYRPRFHDFKDAQGKYRSYFDVKYVESYQGGGVDIKNYPTPNANGVVPHITEQWMRWKFSGKWVAMVMAAGIDHCSKFKDDHEKEVFTPWILLPVGNPRSMTSDHIHHLKSQILVKYLQGKEFTCLYDSFASALHYLHESFPTLDMRNAGYLLSRMAKKVKDLPLPSQVNHLIEDVKRLVPRFETVIKWDTKKKSSEFDLLSDISDFPTVVVPMGSDSGVQHAFTVVGRLIFDSNSNRALHLTKESLDWCCAVPGGGYVRVFVAARILTSAPKFLKMNEAAKNGSLRSKKKRKKKNKQLLILPSNS